MKDNLFTNTGDFAAIFTALGTFAQFLPEVAAIFAILWTGIRIYEWFRFRIKGQKNLEDKFL